MAARTASIAIIENDTTPWIRRFVIPESDDFNGTSGFKERPLYNSRFIHENRINCRLVGFMDQDYEIVAEHWCQEAMTPFTLSSAGSYWRFCMRLNEASKSGLVCVGTTVLEEADDDVDGVDEKADEEVRLDLKWSFIGSVLTDAAALMGISSTSVV